MTRPYACMYLQGLTSALYDLTTYPEYILPMREEVEHVIAEEGWSKASLARMHKLDSFLRESLRLTGSAAGALYISPSGPPEKS